MIEKWGISSQTMCLDEMTLIQKTELQADLQKLVLNVIVMPADDHFLDGVNDKARRVAQPFLNTGSVKFNGEFTITILSHESLHLAFSHKILATLF